MKAEGNLKVVGSETSNEETKDLIMEKINRTQALCGMIKERNLRLGGLDTETNARDAIQAVGDSWVLAEIAIDELQEAYDMTDGLKID